MDAAAVSADYQRPSGYSRYSLTYSHLREIPATLGAVLDIIGKVEPESTSPSDPISTKARRKLLGAIGFSWKDEFSFGCAFESCQDRIMNLSS
jgi:hypothetical protein